DGFPKNLRNLKILAMMSDREGNSWIATSRVLIRIDESGTDEAIVDEKTGVTALYEDREGNLWMGGRDGLERVRDNTFHALFPSGASQSGGPIHVDGSNRVWFAPLDGGLHWTKGGRAGAVTSDGLDRDVIYSLTGRGNELWIARQQGGLTHLEFTDRSIRSRTYKQKDGLPQDSVYVVYQNRDGTVWAGTLNGGVSSYSRGSFAKYTTIDGMSSNSITAIAEGPDHSMWFGTANGLDQLVDERWRIFNVN